MGIPKADGGMGFRDIHHFNLALLAKQCWRLIQEPDSLWARILKGLYFPDCSFMDVVKGYRASWSWSSLLEARDCFMGEGFWQVVNGNDINIRNDRWLPHPNAAKVRVIGAILADGPVSVSSLIDWDLKQWNTRDVDNVIHPHDLHRITNIPIGDGIGKDRFLWPWRKNGMFSVGSGYHWFHSKATISRSPNTGSSHQFDPKIWKVLWNIKTLPKVRVFLWRVIHGAAPTMSSLHKRRIVSNPLCPLCGMAEETFKHLLLLCQWVDPI
ncbi:hypothetical protein ACLB2K_072007 [Fragaria x ananassa]